MFKFIKQNTGQSIFQFYVFRLYDSHKQTRENQSVQEAEGAF